MTGLAAYKILFMTELLIAEILFTHKMKRRKHFAVRVAIALCVCYAIAVGYPVFMDFAFTSWYTSLMFFFLFIITYFALVAVYDIGWGNAFFCAVSGYTVQHLAYGIVSMCFTLIGNFDFSTMYTSYVFDFSAFDERTAIVILSYLNIYVFVYCMSYFFLAPRFKNIEDLKMINFKILFLVFFFLLVDIILNAVVVYGTSSGTNIYVAYIYNFLCCILIFYIQSNIVSEKKINTELERVSEALRQSKKQYELQKENINLINMKCHDLKYQISRYAVEGGMDRKTVTEIENMISIYDATVKTGNEVLDIILTEKSLSCNDKRIKLACMVTCSDFGEISEGDLYALFGNIIDNSIEAANKIGNEDKRCITLDVHTVNKFISVKISNYYEGEIKFADDGLPETSKHDKHFHGFGMRSVAAIIEKYGGTLSIVAKDEIFTLTILFPLSVN